MIRFKAKIPQIDATGAMARLVNLQMGAIYDAADHFRISQARRIRNGLGPNGPQKGIKATTIAEKRRLRYDYPERPLVATKLLSRKAEWRVIKESRSARVVAPDARVEVIKHLKKRGFTFGVSREELEKSRDLKRAAQERWRLSQHTSYRWT